MIRFSNLQNLYIKSFLYFLPVFLILYGTNPYGTSSTNLYSNPFQLLENEQWLQESPIQYFIGFVINLFVKNERLTHYIVIAFGFLILYLSMYLYDQKFSSAVEILKVFYFTPFFLIIFYWMGKPDTFLIASFLLLITYKENYVISCLSSIFLIFSHVYIGIIYILLTIFLKITKFNFHNYLNFVIAVFTYFIYRINLPDIDSRYEVISSEIQRALYSSFTNLLAGIVSLFMWLWIPIFLSNVFSNKKFLFSFMFILVVSFFTLDHTRIFVLSSLPLLIFLTKSPIFIQQFKKLTGNYWIYLLGILQIQKRGDGKIVDGWGLLEFDIFKEFLNKLINEIEQIKSIF